NLPLGRVGGLRKLARATDVLPRALVAAIVCRDPLLVQNIAVLVCPCTSSAAFGLRVGRHHANAYTFAGYQMRCCARVVVYGNARYSQGCVRGPLGDLGLIPRDDVIDVSSCTFSRECSNGTSTRNAHRHEANQLLTCNHIPLT